MRALPPYEGVLLNLLGNRELARMRRDARKMRVGVQDLIDFNRGRMDNGRWPGRLPEGRTRAIFAHRKTRRGR